MIKSENFFHLQTEVANKAYQLYEAVAVLADETTVEETDLPETIEQMIIYVQEIGEEANSVELAGLNRVCELTQEYLFELSTEDEVKRLELCHVIERWPRLVANYLQGLNDRNCCLKLVNYLQNDCWQKPLEDAEAVALIDQLVEDSRNENVGKVIKGDEENRSFEVGVSSLELEDMILEELPASEELEDDFLEEVSKLDQIDLAEVNEEELEHVFLEVSELEDVDLAKASVLPSDTELNKMLDEATFDLANEDELEKMDHHQDSLSETIDLSEEVEDGVEDEDLSELAFSDEELAESDLISDDDELALEEDEDDLIIEDSIPQQMVKPEEDIVAITPSLESKPSKILLELLDKIAEIEVILADALKNFLTVEEENEVFLESVEKYTNTLQFLWEFVAERGLSGLQEVCTFMNDNFFELSSQSQSERQSLRARFLLWPQLVLDYLRAPDQKATTLVEFLQDTQWPLPLLKKQTKSLLVQLVQEAMILHTKPNQPKFEVITESRTESAVKPQEVTVAESVAKREKAVARQANAIATKEKPDKIEKKPQKNERAFSYDLEASPSARVTADPPLKSNWESAFIDEDVLLASEGKENELLMFSEDFDAVEEKSGLIAPTEKRLREKSEDIDTSSLSKTEKTDFAVFEDPIVDEDEVDGLDTVSLLEQTQSSHLDEETLSLSADSFEKESPVFVEESGLTEENFLEDEASLMIESPARSLEESDDIIAPSHQRFANVEVFDSLQAEITDATKDLTLALAKLLTAPEGSEVLLEAAEQYTDNVQAIYDTAQQLDLIGVQEVCSFINNNLFELSLHPPAIRRTTQSTIETWPQLLQQYLQTPVATAPRLVELLRQPLWPVPLSDSEAESLQLQLIQDVIRHSAKSDQDHSIEIDQQTKLERPQTSLNEDRFTPSQPVTESQSDSFDLATESTNDLIIPQTEETSQNDHSSLAPPEVLEILLTQLADAREQLTTALSELMTAPEGSETLLMAVATYTENVQSLWEVAEMAGLIGLQEVCTFINDNIMTLSMQTVEQRSSAYDVLATWIELVQAYLQSPTQVVRGLISHLQSQQWPTPLTPEQAQQLQQQLLQNLSSEISLEEVTHQPLSVDEEESDRLLPAREDGRSEEGNERELQVAMQISEIVEQLLSALEVCVSMENDNPALLEAIESYTNQVQTIWDAAETAGLVGLQQICTFINDNVMAFSLQEPATKLVAQSCFKQWPNAVLEYLHAPTTGAHTLIELLKNSAWPMPLEEESVDEWLALLLQSSTAPEQVTAYQSEVLEESFETVEESQVVENTLEVEEVIEDSTPSDLNLETTAENEISLGSAEVLEILRAEIESVKEDLTTELDRFMTLTAGDAQLAAENYADTVQRLQVVAEMLGLAGLQAVCTFIADNVKTLSGQDSTVRTKAKKLLIAWPDAVLGYLSSPETSVVPLINLLREPQWTNPLSDEQAYTLLGLLTQGTSQTEEEEEISHRETEARPEDVSLAVPEDINRDLLDAYLQEAPQYAADFSECIQNIIAEPTPAEIQKAKRIAHTLKGSSNIIGIKGIANVGHHLEDILEFFTSHQEVTPPKELTDMMVEAADCLEGMVDALTGQDDAPPHAQRVLQNILDWANRIDRGNLNAPSGKPVAKHSPVSPSSKEEKGSSAATKPQQRAEPQPTAAPVEKSEKKAKSGSDAGTPEQILKVPTKTVDNLMRLVGELSISTGQIQERLKHLIGSVRQLNQQDLILQRKTFELENIVDVRGITGIEGRQSKSLAEEEGEEFDPLEFEEYNELHSVSHSFIESIADNRELGVSIRHDLSELEGMFIHQERLNKEFEAAIMTTRMVPVNTIVSKLQRNVRQTCRTTGKQAEIEISGADILVDSDVLNNLGDPLMHILRNSIDHGLEMPEERRLLGKSETGLIKVDFYRQGNNVVVSCKDDGQGLNYANIRYAAIQRGIIREEQEMTEADLARLILMSGFSTKSGVTQVSGRGVGMDVVHTNIRQMKGTLDLHSETGKGMTILIKLPMTLVTVHVLLIRIGSRRFGIPTNHLEQALAPGLGEFQRIGAELTLKLGKHIYALKSLAHLLNVPSDKAELDEHEKRPIILAREETGVVALVVDELLDGRNLVMKNMGRYVTKVRGVAGASILGDGTVVPLLDLPELLRSPLQAIVSSHLAVATDGEVTAATAKAPHIMIVDDSLSVRKSLSLLVEDAGFETLLAKDGLEAIEVMNQKRPDVMLVDMEMPRMNGLELTAHVRANQATQNMPIFMITSRTTEKHREQAKSAGVSAYLNKPYSEVELLSLIDKALAGQLPVKMV